jgi:hypothetical protein
MCIICVEIMRERLGIENAKDQILEALRAGAAYDEHTSALAEALRSGDSEKIKAVVKAGEKKERWI